MANTNDKEERMNAKKLFAKSTMYTDDLFINEFLERLNTPVDESARRWLMARNWLLGFIQGTFYLKDGAELAAESTHPDAVWITNLFTKDGRRGYPLDRNEFLEWLTPEFNDACSLIYAHCCGGGGVLSYINRALAMGNGLARALTTEDRFVKFNTPNIKLSNLTLMAAIQDEPGAWYQIGYIFLNGMDSIDCPDHRIWARRCYERAAQLNYLKAQLALGESKSLPYDSRLYWMGRAVKQGYPLSIEPLYEDIYKEKEYYNRVPGCETGRKIFGTIRLIKEILNRNLFKPNLKVRLIGPQLNLTYEAHREYEVEKCYTLYNSWCKLTKQTVDAWSMSAIRCKFTNRDIRIIISRLIWETRGEALYALDGNGELLSENALKAFNSVLHPLEDALQNALAMIHKQQTNPK